MTEPLKSCPFCGGDADFSEGLTGEGKVWHYLECVTCEAMGPRVQYADHNIAIKGALADAWNTRSDATAGAEKVQALVDAAQLCSEWDEWALQVGGVCPDRLVNCWGKLRAALAAMKEG